MVAPARGRDGGGREQGKGFAYHETKPQGVAARRGAVDGGGGEFTVAAPMEGGGTPAMLRRGGNDHGVDHDVAMPMVKTVEAETHRRRH